MIRRIVLFGICFLLAHLCVGQIASTTQITTSDPQAVTLLNAAQIAISGSTSVTDITLTGSARWIAGSTNESGTIQLLAKETTEAVLNISAGSFSRTELRNDVDLPSGQVTLPDGSKQPIAWHNCFTPAPWFSPSLVLSSLSSEDVTLRYIGSETRNGVSVDHIRGLRTIAGQPQKITSELQQLSTTDIFLDSTTHLPVALKFNTHPDDDLRRDLPIEVLYGNYQAVSGINIPFHIRRKFMGTLQLDVTLTSASINSGLSDSSFAIN